MRRPRRTSFRSAGAEEKEVLSRYDDFYRVIRAIPKGRVATYGQIAALAGFPGHARQVGYALHALPECSRVPWHRVINSRGALSLGRGVPGGELRQRFRLEAEGVEFRSDARVAIDRFGWKPGRLARRSRTR